MRWRPTKEQPTRPGRKLPYSDYEYMIVSDGSRIRKLRPRELQAFRDHFEVWIGRKHQ